MPAQYARGGRRHAQAPLSKEAAALLTSEPWVAAILFLPADSLFASGSGRTNASKPTLNAMEARALAILSLMARHALRAEVDTSEDGHSTLTR